MVLLKRANAFSIVGISVAGGVMHNMGQIIAATIILGSNAILAYMPVLIISGLITGALIGIVSALIIKKFNALKLI